ncbi:hypothetical protein K1719_014620 [Acacia pycnantha]|nr:hypothetical protein K1719_014620 [Acacia pycnantha]
MELEEAEDDLRAMRLLYRLLQHNSLGLQNSTSEDLVERAKELLKNMLEVASERVFETILKIIASEAGISKTPFTSQPGASLRLMPLLAAKSSHCSLKYPTRSRFPSQKDEQPLSKSPAKKAGPRPSKCSVSDKGKTIRKELFNAEEESGIMLQNLVKAANLSSKKPVFPIEKSSQHERKYSVSTFHVGEHSKQPPYTFDSKAGELREVSETSLPYRVCEIESNPSASSRVEAQGEEGDNSRDLFNAIKRIESRIAALQLYSSLVFSKKNGTGYKSMHRITNSESPIGQKKEGIAENRPSYGKSLLEGNGSMNEQANPLASKSENSTTAKNNGITTQRRSQKSEACRATMLASRGENLLSQNGLRPPALSMAMVDRFQSLNRLASGNDHSLNQANECIQGIRIPLNSITAGPTNKDKPARRKSVAQTETQGREKQPLHHMVPRQAQPHRRSSELKMPAHGYRNRKVLGNRRTHKMRASSPHHHESEEEFSSSSSSMNQKKSSVQIQAQPHWRSSELKMPAHGYRNRKVLGNRRTHKMRASSPHHHESEEFSSSSCSSSPARLTSNQSSDIYCSETEEDIGDSPEDMVSQTYEDSSKESSHSYNKNDAGSSDRMESSSSVRSWHRRRGPEKTTGRLRRLKNKLRLIFHHHHHLHHHHHHDEHDGKMSKADHSYSKWKRIFHGKNKHKLLENGKLEKTRGGGAIAKVSHGKQVGQFHGLVQGILRHIRHSKKRKPSKVVKIKGSRNPKHGNRKKFHWWKMLRRHRGVRLNNGGRLKVGFKTQKRLKN